MKDLLMTFYYTDGFNKGLIGFFISMSLLILFIWLDISLDIWLLVTMIIELSPRLIVLNFLKDEVMENENISEVEVKKDIKSRLLLISLAVVAFWLIDIFLY